MTDTSGAIVPGSTITAVQGATGRTIRSIVDAAGVYSLLYLPVGPYTLRAELPGFKTLVRKVDVRVGDRLGLDLVLEVGLQSEQVEVRASSPLLETTTGSTGQVIDAERISLLPLSDGNPFVLSRLAPGAAYTGDLKFSRPFDNGGTSSIVVDGSSGGNEFSLDGTPNNAHGRRVAYVPPSDAVDEFKVETATFDAQQGHTAGANVNVTMKGGTNRLHGTAYEFYRSDSLSANDYFLAKAGKPKARLSYNRFGGSLGGPMRLPGYDGRDRSFFFVSYEGLHDEFPEPGQFTVPSERMRAGDFSELLSQGIVIYNPYSAVKLPNGRIQRQPFPGNIIPPSMISPIALNYLQLYPQPNQPGDAQGRNNYLGPNGRSDDFDALSVRLDHQLSPRHHIFARYSWNDRQEARNNWTGVVAGIRPTGNYLFRKNHNVLLDEVYSHSNATVLNVRLGFSRFEEPNVRQHQGEFDPASLGFSSPTVSYFRDARYVPRFEIGGMSVLGDSFAGGRYTQVFSVQPTLTRLIGRHSLRFGYDFRVHRDNNYPNQHAAGRYDFNTDFTRGPLDNSPSAAIGQQLAAFMLGQPTGGLIDRSASRANEGLYHAAFVQDDWKVTPRLTLNIGLRYDYEAPVTERYDRNILSFDTALANPIAAAAEAAYASKPIAGLPPSQFDVQGGLTFLSKDHRGFWDASTKNFQPRLGFAYQLASSTVVRGGWGVYAVPLLVETFNQAGFSQSTNVVPTQDAGLSFVADLVDPFPSGVLDPPGSSLGAATFLGRDLDPVLLGGVRNNEQNMRWALSVQRQLGPDLVLEAGYVGSYGYDLVTQWSDGTTLRSVIDINAVPAQYLSTSPTRDTAVINDLTSNVPNPFQGLIPGTSLNGTTVQKQQLLRPYPEFGNIRAERRDGTSSYHALQFRAEKRFTNHYTLLLGYTWSRFKEKRVLLNPQDADPLEYFADGDIPHRLTLSGIWELPFGKGRKLDLGKVGNALLGGISVQGIWNWQSGRPITFGNIYYGGDPSVLTSDYADPDRVFDTSGFYFSDAAVQVGGVVDPSKQRADQRIRLSNNIRYFPFRPSIRNQSFSLLDASIVKTVHLARDVKLQLRFEAINALNTVVYNDPETSPTSSEFGKVTSQANIPRNLQLAVKLIF